MYISLCFILQHHHQPIRHTRHHTVNQCTLKTKYLRRTIKSDILCDKVPLLHFLITLLAAVPISGFQEHCKPWLHAYLYVMYLVHVQGKNSTIKNILFLVFCCHQYVKLPYLTIPEILYSTMEIFGSHFEMLIKISYTVKYLACNSSRDNIYYLKYTISKTIIAIIAEPFTSSFIRF